MRLNDFMKGWHGKNRNLYCSRNERVEGTYILDRINTNIQIQFCRFYWVDMGEVVRMEDKGKAFRTKFSNNANLQPQGKHSPIITKKNL